MMHMHGDQGVRGEEACFVPHVVPSDLVEDLQNLAYFRFGEAALLRKVALQKRTQFRNAYFRFGEAALLRKVALQKRAQFRKVGLLRGTEPLQIRKSFLPGEAVLAQKNVPPKLAGNLHE